MSADELFKIAGEAAEILETMGFTAVARKRDGIVTLECWRPFKGRMRTLCHTVSDSASLTPASLAAACDAELSEA